MKMGWVIGAAFSEAKECPEMLSDFFKSDYPAQAKAHPQVFCVRGHEFPAAPAPARHGG